MTNARREHWIAILRTIADARLTDGGALQDGGLVINLLRPLGKALYTDGGQLRELANELAQDARIAQEAGRKAGRPRTQWPTRGK